jgi:hypothetical protein
MHTRRTCLLCLGAALTLPALAQEGHPLTGTWHGTWSPAANQQIDLTFVIEWDGNNIGGIINPGFDGMRIENARLEPEGWVFRFETQAKDAAGNPVRVTAEGKIENITNVRRSISGTWTQGQQRGEFKITRDN